MNRSVQRIATPHHYLIVDTNVLWCHDKSNVLSPEFLEFWNEYSQEFDLDLMVPEVVKNEILYQQTTSSLRKLERINDSFKTLSSYTDVDYSHRVSEPRVKRDIQQRLDKCFSKLKAKIVPTPITIIDWAKLIHSAVWRKAPFTEEKDTEKGFRDSLVLECTKHFCIDLPMNEVAFISADRLLRETAADTLLDHSGFTAYESLDEFGAYLNLRKEELTDEFVKNIARKARRKFFDSKKGDGFLVQEDLINKIKTEYAVEFKKLEQTKSLGLLAQNISGDNWKPASKEKIWVSSARYEKLEGKNTFFWKSGVTFVQLFEYNFGDKPIFLSPRGTQKIRRIHFIIIWKTNIGNTGRFQNMKIETISLQENAIIEPTHKLIDDYQLTLNKE